MLFIPLTLDDIVNLGVKGDNHIPHIGDDTPDGWVLIESVMVDSSGFGVEGETALTLEQFKKTMQVGKGYATVNAGQFQVHVGVFEKVTDE